jgi:hypothetical protein
MHNQFKAWEAEAGEDDLILHVKIKAHSTSNWVLWHAHNTYDIAAGHGIRLIPVKMGTNMVDIQTLDWDAILEEDKHVDVHGDELAPTALWGVLPDVEHTTPAKKNYPDENIPLQVVQVDYTHYEV